MATRVKTTRKNAPPSLKRATADAEKAAALAEVAKRQVRSAKAELKKARKLAKTAKKTAKQARKRIAAAESALRKEIDAKSDAAKKATAKAPKPSPPRKRAVNNAVVPKKSGGKTFKSAAEVARSVIGRLSAAKAATRGAATPKSDSAAESSVADAPVGGTGSAT